MSILDFLFSDTSDGESEVGGSTQLVNLIDTTVEQFNFNNDLSSLQTSVVDVGRKFEQHAIKVGSAGRYEIPHSNATDSLRYLSTIRRALLEM